MKNYEYEQNKNYESTKQMFEECRKDVGVSKGVKRAIPVVDDEICFSDIPENGVCITSQFENGLCGEIIWCRNGEDIYMLHSSIRLKLFSEEGTTKKMKNEFQGIFISPSMQVKRFYEYCFWPNYVKGIRPIQEDSLNFYEILKKIVRCIGSDFQYDLETMRI